MTQAFEYVAVDNICEASEILASADGDGRLLAGGQSLWPMMGLKLLRPSVIIDINRIPDMSYVADRGDHVRIGALTRHRAVETSELVGQCVPVLREAMGYLANLAVRNRGTIGGSLSHADPAAELPMISLLLDARVRLASIRGIRSLTAAKFFRGPYATDLDIDEILVSLDVPKLPKDIGWAFEEVARGPGDFALVGVAVTLRKAPYRITEAKIAMMGVADTPLRALEAEVLLSTNIFDVELLATAVDLIRDCIEPITDVHATSDYRRHLVGVLAERAILRAWSMATETNVPVPHSSSSGPRDGAEYERCLKSASDP